MVGGSGTLVTFLVSDFLVVSVLCPAALNTRPAEIRRVMIFIRIFPCYLLFVLQPAAGVPERRWLNVLGVTFECSACRGGVVGFAGTDTVARGADLNSK